MKIYDVLSDYSLALDNDLEEIPAGYKPIVAFIDVAKGESVEIKIYIEKKTDEIHYASSEIEKDLSGIVIEPVS
ncbi:hypothetical protein [Endozoicomonas acroporae]|uniref:hypothetical protein n=1 Tax=Endozoicomonas acroporae TaxID=1701104 RepID=UPI003D792611